MRLQSGSVREEDHAGKRTMLPAHTREHARWRHTRKEPTVRPEEASMRAAFAPLVGMFGALKPRLGGRSTRPLQTDEEAAPEP